ncbi:hypothetical protein ACP2AV_03880 [Aliiroseovarius sp. PTFE2010]|uniref:hypothetical protein n=1 Tax=Aliiroseovarius sp. PTFE2010 TaxID=3417190 RepID=UPI003CEC59F4
MSRPNPFLFAVFLAAIVAILGGAVLIGGRLLISNYEIDTLHFVQIVLRLDAGERIHHDFATPIGVLAFAPIHFWTGLGLPVAQAFPLGQMLVAALLAVPVWRAGTSRMRGAMPWIFGLGTLSLVLAMVFGDTSAALSVSMHYNRWAWGIAFAALALAVLPDLGPRRPALDGVLIGLLMGVLAVLKLTYFVAFALPVLVAVVLVHGARTLGFAVIGGVAVGALVTLGYGPSYWPAYLADLRMVAGSELRAAPGASLSTVLAGPAYLGGTLCALLGAIFLRQSGQKAGGLLILILIPAFVYVTYQNFGNDPQWQILLGVLLITLRPENMHKGLFGIEARSALTALGIAAFALGFPSAVNTLKSPFRHFGGDLSDYIVFLPEHAAMRGVMVNAERQALMNMSMPLEDRIPALKPYASDEREEIKSLEGVSFPRCTTTSGLVGMRRGMSAALADLLPPGAGIFETDTVNSIWLFGPYRRLKGGAVWYYGGLPGIEDASHVLVPMCPFVPRARAAAIDALTQGAVPLQLVGVNDFFALYAILR